MYTQQEVICQQRQEIERLRGQLSSVCAANVHLILQDKQNKKQMEKNKRAMEEKDEQIRMLQDKERGVTRDLVKYILSNAQLAALSEELTSENEKLKMELEQEKFVAFSN